MKTGQWYHGDGPNSEPEPGMSPGSRSLDSKPPAVPSHSPQLPPSCSQPAASTIAQEPSSSLVAPVACQLQSRPDRHDDRHADPPMAHDRDLKPQMSHPSQPPLLQTDVVTAPASRAEISDPARRMDVADHPGHRMDCQMEAPESGSRLESTQGSRDPMQQQQHQQQQSDYVTFQQNLGFVEQDVWNPALERQIQQPLREVSFIAG